MQAASSMADAGKSERAARIAEESVQSQPERPEAYAVWGRALAQLDKLVESAEKYELSLQHGATDREVFLELANVYDVAAKYDDSVRIYTAYLGRFPGDPEFHQQLGLTLILQEKFDAAVSQLREAVRLKPGDLQIVEDLGQALLRAGNLTEAEKMLGAVLAAAPSHVPALRFAAETAAGLGHMSAALDFANRALQGDPKDNDTRRLRARLLLLTDQAAQALEDFALLVRAQPDDARLRLGEAGALLLIGRLDEAEQRLRQVRASLGGSPQLRLRELQLALRRGDRTAFIPLTELGQGQLNSLEIWQEVARQAKQRGDAKWQRAAQQRLTALGQAKP